MKLKSEAGAKLWFCVVSSRRGSGHGEARWPGQAPGQRRAQSPLRWIRYVRRPVRQRARVLLVGDGVAAACPAPSLPPYAAAAVVSTAPPPPPQPPLPPPLPTAAVRRPSPPSPSIGTSQYREEGRRNRGARDGGRWVKEVASPDRDYVIAAESTAGCYAHRHFPHGKVASARCVRPGRLRGARKSSVNCVLGRATAKACVIITLFHGELT